MNPHDDLIEALLKELDLPDLGGEIRLLGRVCDDLIQNNSTDEVYLIIPDLHLLTADLRKRYSYGFNYSETDPGFKGELLTRLLRRLYDLKTSWQKADGPELITIQLGDFFDLWREFPGSVDQSVIGNAHEELLDLLYRGEAIGAPCLEAVMILGNHDTRNGEFLEGIKFGLNYFNESDNGKPFLFVNHGDAYDLGEKTPEIIKETLVYYLSGLHPAGSYDVGKWSNMAAAYDKTRDYSGEITKAVHDLSGNSLGAPRVTSGGTYEAFVCNSLKTPTDEEAEPHFFRWYYEAIDDAMRNNRMGQNARVVVMGHTHDAKMFLYKPADGSRPLLLMDVGAWIEKCKYPLAESGKVICEPNAQVGVIHGNDARIYQISLPQYREKV